MFNLLWHQIFSMLYQFLHLLYQHISFFCLQAIVSISLMLNASFFSEINAFKYIPRHMGLHLKLGPTSF